MHHYFWPNRIIEHLLEGCLSWNMYDSWSSQIFCKYCKCLPPVNCRVSHVYIITCSDLRNRYNMSNLVDHFHSRGLYRSIFLRYPPKRVFLFFLRLHLCYKLDMTSIAHFCSIMEGEQSFKKFSPELLVQDESIARAVSLLPPIILFHGTNDSSVPSYARLISFPTVTPMILVDY